MIETKKIKRKYHFLRDQVSKNKSEIEYCNTKMQLANILTRPLKRVRFNCLKKLIRMRELVNMN